MVRRSRWSEREGSSLLLTLRLSLFGLACGALVSLPACGSNDPEDPDADLTIDAAVPPPDADFCASMTYCDILGQRCCLPGEKCTAVRDEGEMVWRNECTPDGTVELDGACVRASAGEADDCVAGTYCYLGRCMPFCDPHEFEACEDGGRCTSFQDVPICVLPCDPLGQNCPPGSGCIITPSEAGCTGAGSADVGDVCAFAATCLPGAGCLDDGMGGGVCRAYCDYATYPDLNDPVYCEAGELCTSFVAGSPFGACVP